jgi:hypothetical protein
MVAPDPDVAPETPDWTTDQAKVVPVTLLVNAIDEVAPEQMLCADGVAVVAGVGLTVIITFFDIPAQPLAVGIMV